jgi:hypothetical protein
MLQGIGIGLGSIGDLMVGSDTLSHTNEKIAHGSVSRPAIKQSNQTEQVIRFQMMFSEELRHALQLMVVVVFVDFQVTIAGKTLDVLAPSSSHAENNQLWIRKGKYIPPHGYEDVELSMYLETFLNFIAHRYGSP